MAKPDVEYDISKSVNGFINREELFLIPDALTIFPFLLENKLVESGTLLKSPIAGYKHVIIKKRIERK